MAIGDSTQSQEKSLRGVTTQTSTKLRMLILHPPCLEEEAEEEDLCMEI